jgi:hypothetical protein
MEFLGLKMKTWTTKDCLDSKKIYVILVIDVRLSDHSHHRSGQEVAVGYNCSRNVDLSGYSSASLDVQCSYKR